MFVRNIIKKHAASLFRRMPHDVLCQIRFEHTQITGFIFGCKYNLFFSIISATINEFLLINFCLALFKV